MNNADCVIIIRNSRNLQVCKVETKAASPFHSAPHSKVIISELHRQLSTPFTYLSPVQAEKKKAAQGDDSHGNPEIERLRKEVQDTKQINKKLRELLQVWRFMFALFAVEAKVFRRSSVCDE